jgi:hypothetical protein
VEAHNLPFALCVRGHGDYCRDRDDAAALALFEVGRIQPQIWPVADERAVEEGADAVVPPHAARRMGDPGVDVFAELADSALADPSEPHRLHQVVDAPRRDATDPVDPLRGSTLDHRHQGLLRRLPRLEKGREVAALAQLGYAQLQAAEACVQDPVPVAVAIGRTLAGAFVPARADQPFHVGLHQQLHHSLSHAAQEVAIARFGQQLGQR